MKVMMVMMLVIMVGLLVFTLSSDSGGDEVVVCRWCL